MSPESAKADSCGAEPAKPFEMSHRSRSSTTSFPLWSALQRRCKNLTRRPLALRKIQRSLQRAQKVCSRQIVLLLCCPKNYAGSVTCECSSMFEPPCAIFLLKHSFTGFTASSTGLDGNPAADGLPSWRVKRYKKGLGRHATGPSAKFERPSWFMCYSLLIIVVNDYMCFFCISLLHAAEHEMTTGGLVVGCGWICMDLYLLPWKPVLWESHGSQAKLKEVQTPFFLNLESLNVADLLRSTARDERKDHKHRCRCKERRQVYAWIPPGLPSFWLFLTHLPPFLKLHSCQDCKYSILCNTCNTAQSN